VHALKRAGLEAVEFPEGAGAIYVSVRLSAPHDRLRCIASDETGERLAHAPMIGTERQMARLPLPAGPARKIQIHFEDEAGAAPGDILDIRVEARPDSDAFALPRWAPNVGRWRKLCQRPLVRAARRLALHRVGRDRRAPGPCAYDRH
jgi:hypothetical protein